MDQLSELTLLYVEDDNELRKQFVRALKPRFKKIYEAADGLEALENYKKYSPDTILIDINLPLMDGLSVIEKIRENDKDTPVVILSAYSDQAKLLRAVSLRLTKYLIKPVSYETVLDVFQSMVLNDIAIVNKNRLNLCNSYSWKIQEKILYYNNEIIFLTKHEKIFFEFMMQQLNKVVTFNSLENLLWEGEDSLVAYSSLTQLLKRLRKKLPQELIENIYAEGYRIRSEKL